MATLLKVPRPSPVSAITSKYNRGSGSYVNIATGYVSSSVRDPGVGYRKVSYAEAVKQASLPPKQTTSSYLRLKKQKPSLIQPKQQSSFFPKVKSKLSQPISFISKKPVKLITKTQSFLPSTKSQGSRLVEPKKQLEIIKAKSTKSMMDKTSGIGTSMFSSSYGQRLPGDLRSYVDSITGKVDLDRAAAEVQDKVSYKDLDIPSKTVGEVARQAIKSYKEQTEANKKLDNIIDTGNILGTLAMAPYNLGVAMPANILQGTISGKEGTWGVDTESIDSPFKIGFGSGKISATEYNKNINSQIKLLEIQKNKFPAMGTHYQTSIDNLKKRLVSEGKTGATLTTEARNIMSLFSIPGYVGGEAIISGPGLMAQSKGSFAEQARKDALEGNTGTYQKIIDYSRGYKIEDTPIWGKIKIPVYDKDKPFLKKEANVLYKQAYEDTQSLSEDDFNKKYLTVSKSAIKAKEAEAYSAGQLAVESATIFLPVPKVGLAGTAGKIIQKGTLYNMLIENQSGTDAATNLAAGVGMGAVFKTAGTIFGKVDSRLVNKLSGGMRTQKTIHTVKDASKAAKMFKATGEIGEPLLTQTSTFAANKKLAFAEKTGGAVGKFILPAYFTGSLIQGDIELINIAKKEGLEKYKEAKSDTQSGLAGMILGVPIGTAGAERLFKGIDLKTSMDTVTQTARSPEQKVIFQEGTIIKTPGTPFIPETEFVIKKSNIKSRTILKTPKTSPTVEVLTADAKLAFSKKLRSTVKTVKETTFKEATEFSKWSDVQAKGGKTGARVEKALQGMKNYLKDNAGDVGLGGSASSTFSYTKDVARKIFKNKDLKSNDFDVVVKPLFGETGVTQAQAKIIAKEFQKQGLRVDIQNNVIDPSTYFKTKTNVNADVVIHKGQGGWEVSVKTAGGGSDHFASIHGIKATGLDKQLDAVSNIQDFSRTTSWVRTKEGIDVLNPAIQARRKFMGGYESGRAKDIDWFKDVAYEGYGDVLGKPIRPVPEPMAFNLSNYAPKQQLLILKDLATPSKQITGKKADVVRSRDAMRLIETNQLEAIDLLINKRPVFKIERSVVLNPYETIAGQTKILGVTGSKQVDISIKPQNIEFFKEKGFVQVKNLKTEKGEIGLTKFGPNEFINPKNIVNPSYTIPKQLVSPVIYPSTFKSELNKNLDYFKKSNLFKPKYLKAPDNYIGNNYFSERYKKIIYPKIKSTPKTGYIPSAYVTSQYFQPLYIQDTYPDDKYPDDKYPDDKYPDDKYPDDKYPDDKYPDDKYPDDKYPDDKYPDNYYFPNYAPPYTGGYGGGYGGGLYGMVIPASGGASRPRKRSSKFAKGPGRKQLIQVKSSLFRKFAFGEKDLLVDKESLAQFKRTIGKKGTFFGYDAVPTQEQLNAAEDKLWKSQAEAKYLKGQKSILDIEL